MVFFFMNMKKGIQTWKNVLRFVLYYFSINRLIRTLFYPWHRDRYRSTERGVWGIIENLVFWLFTRILGFLIRSLTILAGIIVFAFVVLSFPLFLFYPNIISFKELSKYGSIGKTWSYPLTYYLDQHGIDLRLLPDALVIDHDNGIKQIERILSKEGENNVLVVGGQGVGKTTRLSYLAKKMYRDLSTPRLNSKRLVELFPEELKNEEIIRCIHDAVNAGNVVLVIENIERFNILPLIEPYLNVKHFQIILTTDEYSYNEKFKHKSGLMRFVEVVKFFPPNDEITLLYLIDYVTRKGVRHAFSDETLSAIVILTNRYILNKYQPQKSMEILEELIFLEDEYPITPEDVEKVISEKTGIPIGALQDMEKDKLLHLEEILKQHIIGQDEAVYDLVSALKRARLNIKDDKRPMGSFLFLGTTGVGKTHTAKILAKYYFGSDDMFHRFDMSEYRELSSLQPFIEELGNRVEKNPYSLVFFDELEKAHPDILNILLQLLDEGIIHTQNGRKISFQSTIVIATSNAGADFLMENDQVSKDLLIQQIIKKGILKPELINRFDEVILFRPLEKNEVKKVAALLLDELNSTLQKRHGIQVSVDEELLSALAHEGYSMAFGLRPLRRLIQDTIETQIADLLLRDDIPESGIIHIDPTTIQDPHKQKRRDHLKYV